jgi:hypothetical protein
MVNETNKEEELIADATLSVTRETLKFISKQAIQHNQDIEILSGGISYAIELMLKPKAGKQANDLAACIIALLIERTSKLK